MNNEVFITDAEKIDPGIDSWSPLTVLRDVLEQLEQRNISYCHWKSNYHLEYALTGVEDVDVLVASADFPPFVQILLAHGFKQADSVSNRMQPGVFHFLGIDGETGTLINRRQQLQSEVVEQREKLTDLEERLERVRPKSHRVDNKTRDDTEGDWI